MALGDDVPLPAGSAFVCVGTYTSIPTAELSKARMVLVARTLESNPAHGIAIFPLLCVLCENKIFCNGLITHTRCTTAMFPK
jgi:hypothetical protein